MILGLGSDICDIRRVERTLERFGARFIERVFTETEQRKAERRNGRNRAGTYAKRFAAKEACAKALGTGISQGVSWTEMGVVNEPSGRPTLALVGRAAERLARMTPPGFRARIDITITDDHPIAQAFVVISAWPEDWPARGV